MKNIIIRSLSGAVYVALIVFSVLMLDRSELPFAVLMGIFVVLGISEIRSMAGEERRFSLTGILDMAGGLFVMLMFCQSLGEIFAILAILWLVVRLAVQLWCVNENALESLQRSFFAIVYVAVPLGLLWRIHYIYGEIVLLAVFVFIWLNDTGAFIVGVLTGRHKMFPRISPKKTWEGLIGGYLFAIAGAVAFCYLLGNSGQMPRQLELWQLVALAVTVSTAATLGDLVESLLKRTAGVKDSGKIIPGHGGILDRIDSLLLVSPMAFLLLILI